MNFVFLLSCLLPQVLLLWMVQMSSCLQPPSLNMLTGCLVPQMRAGDSLTKSSSLPCNPCLSHRCTALQSMANCLTPTKSTKRFAPLKFLPGIFFSKSMILNFRVQGLLIDTGGACWHSMLENLSVHPCCFRSKRRLIYSWLSKRTGNTVICSCEIWVKYSLPSQNCRLLK